MQNKKWRVLIVDDEFRIGRLIKKLIHWDEFALECVDVVDNGGTAFEIIQRDVYKRQILYRGEQELL